MNFEKILLHRLKMKMKTPFTTSFGTQIDRYVTIVEIIDENGLSGFGECVAGEDPLYSEEFMDSALVAIKKYFGPLLLQSNLSHPKEVTELFKPFKRNMMAKSGLETAVWDLYAKQQWLPLYKVLGGEKTEVEVGISLGLEKSDDIIIEKIREKVEEGYKRIKVKIKPGRDVEMIRAIREVFPDIPLIILENPFLHL